MVDKIRLEALINEYKGNLFEYLVANQLAFKAGIEGQFRQTVNDEFLSMLQKQETLIRNIAPHLIQGLTNLSQDVVKSLVDVFERDEMTKIEIMGKTGDIATQGETDILVQCRDGQRELSLKLAKDKSFVNTKSTGIRTFFSKYFDAQESQDRFDFFIDHEFEQFAISMHQEAGVVFEKDFKAWEQEGLEVLPGELRGSFQEHLFDYYQKVMNFVYKELVALREKDTVKFAESLYPLIGQSHKNITQVTCFYQAKNETLTSTKIKIVKPIQDLKCEKIELANKVVNIDLGDFTLQVRLKPMNKFTQKSYKLNCAIKDKVRV